MHRLRLAIPADTSGLRHLIEHSVRKLSVGYYTEAQVKSALRYAFGPDTQSLQPGPTTSWKAIRGSY